MKIFMILTAALAVVYCRPEAGYPPSRGGGNNLFQSNRFTSPGFSSSGPSSLSSSSSSSQFGSPASQYGPPQRSPTVHKHVYVHVPPPEQAEYAPRKEIPVAPPQKHYKIIFIKAPTAPTPTAPVIPVQPQNEEKTLVYVLVKRPEEAPEISIPTPQPTQPSKPEVYFIRYKTQKEEAEAAAQQGYGDSGVPQNQYGAPSPQQEYGSPSAGGGNGGGGGGGGVGGY